MTEIVDNIGNSIVNAIRTLGFSIFEALLNGIDKLYELFLQVARHQLFDDDTIRELYIRIGLILGLFMVFRLTFSAIEYLINPDTMVDKNKGIGNIIKKVLIMIILLGSVHFLFSKAYDLQYLLIDENNIMSKLVLGKQNQDTTTDGRELVSTIFFSYVTVNEKYCSDTGCTLSQKYLENNKNGNDTEGQIKTDILSGDGVGRTYEILNVKTLNGKNYCVYFDWLFAILTAVFVFYVLIVYTIQLGIRVVQLAYLEAIAPIPIMMYLMPKGEETLKKWGQQCLTTFLDAFIRIAILYFIILVFQQLSKNIDLFENGNLLGIVLIIGLFMFAKKVPDLLGELFPSMGGKAGLDFGIKNPKQLWSELKSTPGLNVGTSIIGWGAKQAKKPIDLHKEKMAGIRKERKQARTDLHDFEKREKTGKLLHEKYGDSLPETAFSSSEYRSSYKNVSAAKDSAKNTANELEEAQVAFAAAYNSGNPETIAAARTRLENAKKQDKAAQTRLEVAKQHHEHMKKIHDKDAQIEDAYKQYGDLHPNISQSAPSGGSSNSPRSTPSGGSQPQSMNIEEAAEIVNNPNVSDEDQLRAAEALDNAARARNNSDNNQNNN